jgi:hypothetical protein
MNEWWDWYWDEIGWVRDYFYQREREIHLSLLLKGVRGKSAFIRKKAIWVEGRQSEEEERVVYLYWILDVEVCLWRAGWHGWLAVGLLRRSELRWDGEWREEEFISVQRIWLLQDDDGGEVSGVDGWMDGWRKRADLRIHEWVSSELDGLMMMRTFITWKMNVSSPSFFTFSRSLDPMGKVCARYMNYGRERERETEGSELSIMSNSRRYGGVVEEEEGC